MITFTTHVLLHVLCPHNLQTFRAVTWMPCVRTESHILACRQQSSFLVVPLEPDLLCLLLSYGSISAGAMLETGCCLQQWPMKRLAGNTHDLVMLYMRVSIVRQHSLLLSACIGNNLSSTHMIRQAITSKHLAVLQAHTLPRGEWPGAMSAQAEIGNSRP